MARRGTAGQNTNASYQQKVYQKCSHIFHGVLIGLTKKAEPPPTRDVNRDSGTDSANGGWLRQQVRRHISEQNK